MPPPKLAPRVVRVEIARTEVSSPALAELFGIERLPLAQADVEIEIDGVPTAVVNALRRVATDEMPGVCLDVGPGGFDFASTTDPFQSESYVVGRLRLIPLVPGIPAEQAETLRLRLDMTNETTADLSIYSGDLEVVAGAMPEPLFNPTYKITTLGAGKRIVMNDIRITTGYGHEHGAYIVACRAAFKHLDLEEHPHDETHKPGGAAVDLSGYKLSCLVADPRHHLFTASLPATGPNLADIRTVFADACANIKERLRAIAAAVAAYQAAGTSRGIQYTVIQLEGGLFEAVVLVPGETHTIGELLRRMVFEHVPEISNVAYSIVPHENRLKLSMRHVEDITDTFAEVIQSTIRVFDTLQSGISSAR